MGMVKDIGKQLLISAGILGFIMLLVWWQVYKFNDCKMVGHSTLYCIAKIGGE